MMKVLYFIRLFASLLFSLTLFLFVMGVKQQNTYMMVLPGVMSLFPAMVLGALARSMITGQKQLSARFQWNLRILLILISFFIYVGCGFFFEVFFNDTILAVLVSSLFGLVSGYLLADWHVLLYKTIYSDAVMPASTMVFILGAYTGYVLYHLLAMNLPEIYLYNTIIVICAMGILSVLVLTYVDSSFDRSEGEGTSTMIINDFVSIQRQILLLSLIAFQVMLMLSIVKFCIDFGVFQNQSINGSTYTVFFWLLCVTIIISLVSAYYLLLNSGIYYLIYAAQVIAVMTVLCYFPNIILSFDNSILLYICSCFGCSGAIFACVLFNYFVIKFFKPGLVRIFVPIATAILLFFLAIYQIVMPVFNTMSVVDYYYVYPLVISILLILIVIAGSKMLDRYLNSYD